MVWETVIGLEVHVQLRTRTKMFCGDRTTFGDPPNTNVCPVCLGLPGALPVPNAEAIRLAARGALALGCTVHETSVFAARTISIPICLRVTRSRSSTGARDRGQCQLRLARSRQNAGRHHPDPRRGRRRQAAARRFGEDRGRSTCRHPLAEIVSEPDLRSPAEAGRK